MVEGIPPINTSNGACIGCVVGKHPERATMRKGKQGDLLKYLDWYINILLGLFPYHPMEDQGMY